MGRRVRGYMADDGTVCKTREEMETINEHLDKIFHRERVARQMDMLQSREMREWFMANVRRRSEAKDWKKLEEIIKK